MAREHDHCRASLSSVEPISEPVARLFKKLTDQFRGLTVSFRSILVYLAQGIFLTRGESGQKSSRKRLIFSSFRPSTKRRMAVRHSNLFGDLSGTSASRPPHTPDMCSLPSDCARKIMTSVGSDLGRFASVSHSIAGEAKETSVWRHAYQVSPFRVPSLPFQCPAS